MNHARRPLLALVSCLALCLPALAGALEVGQPFPPYTLVDPHGQTNTLQVQTRFVIITSEKGISEKVNKWLMPKGADYLAGVHAEYVADITPMPGIITTLFALPKMRKYPFKLLLADNPLFAKTYPAKPGKIALFTLDADHKIVALDYLDKAGDVEARLQPATK